MDLGPDSASEAGDSVESGAVAREVSAAAADDPDDPDPVQDVCAAHPLVHSIAFCLQEILYHVDPVTLVSSTINSDGHTVPQFPDCSVQLSRLALPRTRIKVCLYLSFPFVSFLFQVPVKYTVEDGTSDEVGILVIIVLTLIISF